jgi:uncharacterized membrane protein YjjP (DUF1212 family)
MAPTSGSESSQPIAELLAASAKSLERSSLPVSYARPIVDEIANTYGHPATTALFPTLVLARDDEAGHVVMRHVGESYRFDQVAAADEILGRIRQGALTPSQAVAQLDQVGRQPSANPAWVRILGYALQSLGFAMCFRMSVPALIGAVILGLIIGTAVTQLGARYGFGALMPVLATFASALLVSVAARVLDIDDPVRLSAVAVVVLLPGATLIASMIELASGDVLAGSSRLIYAIMVLLSMAFGFVLAIELAGLPDAQLADLTAQQTPAWVPWPGAALFALGNVLFLCTPRRLVGWAIAVPVLAFALMNGAQEVMAAPLAAGVAAGATLLLAEWVASRSGSLANAVILYLPSFWLLVPGSMAFVGLTGVIADTGQFQEMGVDAGSIILGMAVGIMVASLIGHAVRRR